MTTIITALLSAISQQENQPNHRPEKLYDNYAICFLSTYMSMYACFCFVGVASCCEWICIL